jgi:hypothetical protein
MPCVAFTAACATVWLSANPGSVCISFPGRAKKRTVGADWTP